MTRHQCSRSSRRRRIRLAALSAVLAILSSLMVIVLPAAAAQAEGLPVCAVGTQLDSTAASQCQFPSTIPIPVVPAVIVPGTHITLSVPDHCPAWMTRDKRTYGSPACGYPDLQGMTGRVLSDTGTIYGTSFFGMSMTPVDYSCPGYWYECEFIVNFSPAALRLLPSPVIVLLAIGAPGQDGVFIGFDLPMYLYPSPPLLAQFTTSPDPTAPGDFAFHSTITNADGGISLTWDFGDGTPLVSTLTDPQHTYTKPGTYTVTLNASDVGGGNAAATHQVVVAAPTLGVSITVVGGSDSVDPGATKAIDVTVSASDDGVGDLSSLAVDPSTPLGLAISPTTRMSIDTGDLSTLPAALAPGSAATLHFQLTASDDPGNVTLHSAFTAKDAAGRDVTGEGSYAVNVGNTTMAVTVTPAKNDLQLVDDDNGDPTPQTFEVTIEVENTTDGDIHGIVVAPMDIALADPTKSVAKDPAIVVLPNGDLPIGTLAAHAKASVTRTITAQADGIVTLKSLVSSSDSGIEIGDAQLRIGVQTLLKMIIDSPSTKQVVAGQQFVVTGRFENVTQDRKVAITDAMKVLYSGNLLGGGMIARADGVWAAADFAPPLVTKLEPGGSAPFQIRFATSRPSPEQYANGEATADGLTKGLISFVFSPRAAVQADDDSWHALTTAPVQLNDVYASSIKIEGGLAGSVPVIIDTAPLSQSTLLEKSAVVFYGLTASALEGAVNRISSLATSAYSFTTDPDFRDKTIDEAIEGSTLLDSLTYFSAFVTFLPQADADELKLAIAQRAHDAYSAFAETVVNGPLRPQIPAVEALAEIVGTYITRLQGAFIEGNPQDLLAAVTPIGNFTGEVGTDLVLQESLFQGLASMARASRYYELARANQQSLNTITKMQASLPSAAQQALDLNAIELSKSKYPLLEEAFISRRPLTDVDLGVGANKDGAGLARDTIDATRRWTRSNPNKVIVVIPNEANVAAVRDADLAVGKIENIKPKSMATIEYDVLGGRGEDLNHVILRGDLRDLSAAAIDSKVDAAIAAGRATEEDRAVVKQIVDKRNKEWAIFTNRGAVKKVNGQYVPDLDGTGAIKPDDLGIGKLKAYDEAGRIPNQFRGTDNGLAVSGPQLQPKFALEYLDAAHNPVSDPRLADYVVPLQESPKTGALVKITGDDDGIFIGLSNGLGLAKDEIDGAYASLIDVFNHPFSDTWLAQVNKKLEIFSRYFETIPGTTTKGAPLVMMVNGEAYAVKINPWTTRFDTALNRAFIDFVGAPKVVQPILSQPSWVDAFLDPVRAIALPASFLRLFLQQSNTQCRACRRSRRPHGPGSCGSTRWELWRRGLRRPAGCRTRRRRPMPQPGA